MKLCEIVLAFHQRPMPMTAGCGTSTSAAACAIESPTNAACSTPARETDREVVTAAYAITRSFLLAPGRANARDDLVDLRSKAPRPDLGHAQVQRIRIG